MQKIDLAVWPRAELFRFFSTVSDPFYSVTFRVDVTNLHAYTKAHSISFYYALCYLATDAVNAVENFRYTIRDGEVFLLDGFCHAAKAKSDAQQSFLDQSGELDDLIYFSCMPWFDLTAATNERDFDRDDNIPRICWGKYVPADGRETLGMSVEVNHRFIDGYHLGQFYQKLQRAINAL
mgnify:FL=1